MARPIERFKTKPFGLICSTLAALFFSGCGEAGPRPADIAALRAANDLHALLRPAVMDERDARLKTYLDQVGSRIVTAARELGSGHKGPAGNPPVWLTGGDAHFHIVVGQTPNAFTLAGSHVYISSGLFARCEGEDDLAAALCHALAHAYIPRPVAEGGEAGDVVRDVVALRRSPASESAADEIGFALYARAGWEPSRYDALLRLLSPGNESAARVALIRRQVDALPSRADEWRQTPVADPRRFASLRLEGKTLSDESPRDRQARLLVEAMPNCFLPADPPEVARARLDLLPPPAPVEDNPWGKGPRPRPTP